MQSTIFGVWTEETHAHPQLYTRFDYDAVWGTVVNRFVAQAILDVPMSVYGTGLQRTGLMGLDDAVGSLAAMATQRPEAGQHRVINHVTERDPCILDIAEVVSRAAVAHGYTPRIDRGGYNPRGENDTEKAAYRVENAYVASQVSHTPFEKVLAPMFATVATYRDRIRPEVFPPRVRWER
jgi:UDP-sulfoquinovose synthase